MVQVRYFAGARAAAGVAEETIAADTLDGLLALLARRSDRMLAVLEASSFLLDGVAVHDRSLTLKAGSTVDVLPPFAGG